MLVEEIKKRIVSAMKAKRSVEKDILKLALGEIQANEARSGKSLSDQEAQKIIRKLLKSNTETLQMTSQEDRKQLLQQENEVLETLLPKALSVAEIVAALGAVQEGIQGAKSDGQATGVAMKHIKSNGLAAEGKDVQAAVREIRNS